MNKVMIILAGFLFITAGIATGIYQTVIHTEQSKLETEMQQIREGEEYLLHNDKGSIKKALHIFTALSARIQSQNSLYFRINYDLANALEKSDERSEALNKYRKLNQMTRLSREDAEKLNFSLGKILLNMNQDEEGKSHLEQVLRSSTDKQMRSQSLAAIAEYHFKRHNYESARKNYVLALQEDAGNVEARIGWGKALRALGKDWAAYEVFDEYLAHDAYLNPEKGKKVSTDYSSGVYEKGADLFRKKRYHQAIDYFTKAANMNPGTVIEEKALYYTAESHDALGDAYKALQFINKTLNNSVYTMDSMALYKKGTIYFRQKKYDKSSAIFQEVMDKYPDTTVGRKAISWKQESLDQLKESGEVEDKYNEKDVDDTIY